MVTINAKGPPIVEADLDAAEEKMGLALPADLRQHYLAANGGYPTPNAFLLRGDPYCIHQFFPVKHGERGEILEDVFRTSRSYLPATAIPIAIDGGGDYFIYSVAPESKGSIWFHNSDHFDDPDRGMVKLAESFTEFMNALTDAPDA